MHGNVNVKIITHPQCPLASTQNSATDPISFYNLTLYLLKTQFNIILPPKTVFGMVYYFQVL
jgi:hypothetical protein